MRSQKRCKQLNPVYANEIIDRLGGTVIVSKICDVAPASVSDWRKRGMPNGRYMFLAERYKQLLKQYKSKTDLFV